MHRQDQCEIFIATKSVIEGSKINLLHKEQGVWIILSKDELKDDLKFNEDNLFIVDDEYLYGRIPQLRGQLNQDNKTTINVNFETAEVSVNPQHFHLGLPTHGAKATRQANAGFSYLHYLIIARSFYYKPLIILVVLLGLALMFGWFFYIPFTIYAIFKLLEFLKTRDMFYSGALCPAIVIDAPNSKIAALTNLSLGSGYFPIIRIRKYPLPKKYLFNGQKIPVAGGYQNTEKYDHWNYFEPFPLPTGINNTQIISEKINQIPLIEWLELKREIKKLNKTSMEGYYPIKLETSDWKDRDLNAIKWMQFGEEKQVRSLTSATHQQRQSN